MGSGHRWYVDSGSQQGFVPAKILRPFHAATATAAGVSPFAWPADNISLSSDSNESGTLQDWPEPSGYVTHNYKVHNDAWQTTPDDSNAISGLNSSHGAISGLNSQSKSQSYQDYAKKYDSQTSFTSTQSHSSGPSEKSEKGGLANYSSYSSQSPMGYTPSRYENLATQLDFNDSFEQHSYKVHAEPSAGLTTAGMTSGQPGQSNDPLDSLPSYDNVTGGSRYQNIGDLGTLEDQSDGPRGPSGGQSVGPSGVPTGPDLDFGNYPNPYAIDELPAGYLGYGRGATYGDAAVGSHFRQGSGQSDGSATSATYQNTAEVAAQFDPLLATSESNYELSSAHRYEMIPEGDTDAIRSADASPLEETWYAAFAFRPPGPNQIALSFGQKVTVLHKCDLTGNGEWWYVRDSAGQSGYVPANYLKN